jgi:hypothetical protein
MPMKGFADDIEGFFSIGPVQERKNGYGLGRAVTEGRSHS